MAYQQNQQSEFEFDLASTNDTTYENHSLAYQKNNVHSQSLVSSVPDAQMMSHGENHSQYRKDSFATSAGVLSPTSTLPGWESKFASHSNDHVGTMPTHGFRFDNTAFLQHDSNQYYNSGNYLVEHSDSNTPAVFDGIHANHFPNNGHDQGLASPPTFTPIQREPNFKPAPQVQTPMSPHSQDEWKTWSALEKEGRAFPTHIRITSPPKHVEKRRGDGVRKKNAKIDIPDGRTVPVIEELMAGEHDEFMLKELKGQKRLLRNREAALASRQRKKKHTEDLESKVNELNAVIAGLENQVQEYAVRLDAEMAQRGFFEQRLQEADITLDGMRQEKEHMVIQHTQVTSNLRQRIRLLEEPIVSPAPAMSAAPSSSGYTDLNSELDNFNLANHDWDKHIRMFNPENEWEMIASDATIQPSKLLSTPIESEQAKSGDSDQHIPTGVLFMLLLCGAFVAANSASKSPVIPRMPDEVRAVSDTVLTSLLQDMKTDVPNPSNQYSMELNAAWPSHLPESSTMGNLHRQLVSPTRRQLAEQAFMPTPEQYNSITQAGQYPNLPLRQAPKRNLAEILGNMRQNSISKGSSADVYTRSLLWDQVPDHVIKQFKQAVRESSQQAESTDYKLRS